MLFAFDGAAIPVDEAALAMLRDEGVVEDDVTIEDAQKFLEGQLKGDECYQMYVALRAASGSEAMAKAKSKKAKA